VPVEISQPTTIDREALEKALGEALIAADNARTKEKAKWSSLDKVWDEVAKAAPKPIMDAYQDAVRRRSGTRSRLVKTAETMGVHPTPENLQNFGDAVADDAAAGKAEDDAYNALLLALNTELSIRLQIAKGQFLDAINAATQAQANANAAQQALNALTPVAPSPPSPPPPSPPPPPK